MGLYNLEISVGTSSLSSALRCQKVKGRSRFTDRIIDFLLLSNLAGRGLHADQGAFIETHGAEKSAFEEV